MFLPCIIGVLATQKAGEASTHLTHYEVSAKSDDKTQKLLVT